MSILRKNNKNIRLGEEKLNNQGCLMKIIEYIDKNNVIIQFQDKYKAEVHTNYQLFSKGIIKNPYYPSVYTVGIIGNKYPVSINCIKTKEYATWSHMLERCFDKKIKDKYPTYQNISCCNEWLYYENFYEWLHSQENFDKWYNGKRWSLDKDIIIKGNKVYSPETCCLVPQNVNSLFTKSSTMRGNFPIGVIRRGNRYIAQCENPIHNKRRHVGSYLTPEDAFYSGYKPHKEDLIKQVAQIEHDKGNITKKCYDAMMNYQVEIED